MERGDRGNETGNDSANPQVLTGTGLGSVPHAREPGEVHLHRGQRAAGVLPVERHGLRPHPCGGGAGRRDGVLSEHAGRARPGRRRDHQRKDGSERGQVSRG